MTAVHAPARILVVDDDPDMLELLEMRISSAGHQCLQARSGPEALERFRRERPRVVVTDLRMDGMDGHALFEHLHAEASGVPVIMLTVMLTAHGTIREAVAATQRGAFSFLTKPFDGQELLARINEALAVSPAIAGDQHDSEWRRPILSVDPAVEDCLREARRLADCDDPLLILGPPGSGRELLAQSIHDASTRSERGFIVLNARSMGEGEVARTALAEAAVLATGGSLLIEDIGHLAPGLQASLLPWVIDCGQLMRTTRPVRIMASTGQPLESDIQTGRLRSDLGYSLARHILSLPALDRRRTDIPLLVTHFTTSWVSQAKVRAKGFAPDAMNLLCEAPWPGNVRQLRAVVEHALSLAVTRQVPATLVRKLLQENNEREMATLDEARREFERDYLSQLLKATGGNVAQAARIAQRNRTEFYKLLARHELDPSNWKTRR